MSERIGQVDCEETRQLITASLARINYTIYVVDLDHPDREAQETDLSESLVVAKQAYESRPSNCQMESREEDSYECDKCLFAQNIIGY